MFSNGEFKGLDKIVPTSEYIGTGKSYQATTTLVQQLQPVSYRVNAILKHIDPDHHTEAIKVRERLCHSYPGYAALATIDPLIYEGREIIWNRMSGLHTDTQDPPLGWAILTGFGDFKGGAAWIKPLNLVIRYEPGDVLAIRGRVLAHEVRGDFIGQRITIPHFTHSSVWRAVGNESVFVK